jgi:hypothetical protein
MALPITYFKGELDNKDSSYFISKLDFKLNQIDRIKLTNETLYSDTTKDNNHLDKYFQIYFDEKFKCNITKDEYLSENNNVCKTLESIANYILFSDDAKKIKNTEYNFYTVKQLKDKFGNELSVEELIEKTYCDVIKSDFIDKPKLSFILNKGFNYKKSIEQNITDDDIDEIQPISDYQEYKNILYKKLVSLRSLKKDKVLQRKIVKILKEIKSDQICCKDKIKGTIYFKFPLHDSTDIDYEQFDNFDIEHVKALIECNGSLLTDIGCLKYDLVNLINNIRLNDKEKEIIDLLLSGLNTLEVSKMLNIRHHYIQTKLRSIAKRIIREYYKSLNDWYYTFKVKGKYKKCLKCNNVKILNSINFGIDARNKDGYKCYCKCCDKKNV